VKRLPKTLPDYFFYKIAKPFHTWNKKIRRQGLEVFSPTPIPQQREGRGRNIVHYQRNDTIENPK